MDQLLAYLAAGNEAPTTTDPAVGYGKTEEDRPIEATDTRRTPAHPTPCRKHPVPAFVLILLALGICIGYTAAHAQNVCEPSEPQEASQPSPAGETPQKPAEHPAEDYSSLDRLELIGTFTATAYCPCVKCCGIWSEDHPSRSEDYVQKTRAGTIPEEGRTIAADWDVLPKGSEVVINGHPYIVEDTGSAVKGNHVDIFFESHEAACEFGIQQVEVYREAAG